MRRDVTVCVVGMKWFCPVQAQEVGLASRCAARTGPGPGRGREGGVPSCVLWRGGAADGMGLGRGTRETECACLVLGGARLRQVPRPPQAVQVPNVAFSDLCEQESRGRR